jgi:hypothetical protein
MSEYTPTTNDVRQFYQGRLVKGDDGVYVFADEEKSNAEFERWLAGVKAEAWDEGFGKSPKLIYRDGRYVVVYRDGIVLNPYREVVK